MTVLIDANARNVDACTMRSNQPVDFSEADNESQFRFCTECMVTAEDIERRKLREVRSALGDSLVLAGTKRKAKIHIHVDDPDAVFDIARKFGKLSAEKADDMHRQQHSTHDTSRRFAVITDSGADIPRRSDGTPGYSHGARAESNSVIAAISTRSALRSMSSTQELKSSPDHPTTSQPAPGDFRRQFQFLASHFEDVLSINLTSEASGTYEAARLAAAKHGRGRSHSRY